VSSESIVRRVSSAKVYLNKNKSIIGNSLSRLFENFRDLCDLSDFCEIFCEIKETSILFQQKRFEF